METRSTTDGSSEGTRDSPPAFDPVLWFWQDAERRHTMSRPRENETTLMRSFLEKEQRTDQAPPGTDNQALVDGLKRGERVATGAFYDRFQPLVERTLVRILGDEPDLNDLVHDTFLAAMRCVSSVRDAQALPSWLIRIAVRTAADWLRRRKRRRWLMLLNPRLDGAASAFEMDTDGAEAVRETYRLLEQLPVDERVAFALRIIDDRDLTTVAAACGCSLATIKRRLTRAEARFLKLARANAVLSAWVDDRQRWGRS